MANQGLTPQQIHRESAWQTNVWTEQADFSGGIFLDVAPHRIPPNGVYDAQNIIFDRVGAMRKRGGTTAVFSGAQNAVGTRIGAFHSGAQDGLNRVYVFNANANAAYYFNTATGALSALDETITGGLPSTAAMGRPFQHFNTLILPQVNFSAASYGGVFAVGGAVGAKTEVATGTAATVTQGSSAITGIVGINATTAMEAGGFVYATGSGTPKPIYIGRITGINSSSSISVDPTPSATFTATGVAFYNAWLPGANDSATRLPVEGLTGCSWQNRIILGNVHDWNTGYWPRRVSFSVLPNETPSSDTGVRAVQGLVQLSRNAFEPNNYFDIASMDAVTALVPFGEGALLVFSSSQCFRVTGQLTTQTTTSGGVTWDVRELPVKIGCLTDRSIQKMDRGVIFAATDGVYLTDGSSFRPLMSGRIANTWRDGQRGGVGVIGSALVRNHYFVFTGGVGGVTWVVNLDTLAWTRFQGESPSFSQVQFYDSAIDPSSLSTCYGLRYTTVGTSLTGGQVVRLDSIFYPSSTTRTDSDGSNVAAYVVTRPMTPFDQATIANFTRTQFQYDSRNATTTTVSRTVVDPSAPSWTTLGTLPTTTSRSDYTFGMGLTGVQRGLAASHLINVDVADSFEVYALKVAAQGAHPGVST